MISIISLNWNTTDSMIRLYNSIVKNTVNPFDFLIVDNGSRDSEYQKLKRYFENKDSVSIFKNEANLGFAAGNNVGIEMIKRYDYVIFVNSDIIIEEVEWDRKFIELLGIERVGVIGCAYHPLKWTRDGRFHIQLKSDAAIESESVQGAFFGTRYNVLSKLKANDNCYFDENFKFAHYEETDMCFRIMNMGYKCLWFPLSHIHDHNRSATKMNNYALNIEIKNKAEFDKNSEKNRNYLLMKHKSFFERK